MQSNFNRNFKLTKTSQNSNKKYLLVIFILIIDEDDTKVWHTRYCALVWYIARLRWSLFLQLHGCKIVNLIVDLFLFFNKYCCRTSCPTSTCSTSSTVRLSPGCSATTRSNSERRAYIRPSRSARNWSDLIFRWCFKIKMYVFLWLNFRKKFWWIGSFETSESRIQLHFRWGVLK